MFATKRPIVDVAASDSTNGRTDKKATTLGSRLRGNDDVVSAAPSSTHSVSRFCRKNAVSSERIVAETDERTNL
jgi:hypothetical protein